MYIWPEDVYQGYGSWLGFSCHVNISGVFVTWDRNRCLNIHSVKQQQEKRLMNIVFLVIYNIKYILTTEWHSRIHKSSMCNHLLNAIQEILFSLRYWFDCLGYTVPSSMSVLIYLATPLPFRCVASKGFCHFLRSVGLMSEPTTIHLWVAPQDILHWNVYLGYL